MPGRQDNALADKALSQLLHILRPIGYRFITPTPATHARVIARPDRGTARSLAEVLGWNLPFRAGDLDAGIEMLLDEAGVLIDTPVGQRATIRVSSVGDHLFLHSAYPTLDDMAVFFGPDSYRFANLLCDELAARPVRPGARVVDIGAGSGVGGIVAAGLGDAIDLHLTDINPLALRFARLNAAAADITAVLHETRSLDQIAGEIDLAIANPPYLLDDSARLYRDGGAMHGGQVSLDMAEMAMRRLAAGGRLILYTGSAIVRGDDRLQVALARAADAQGCTMRYRELDPDVFGEELDRPAYRDVDRIAVVSAVIVREGGEGRPTPGTDCR